MKKHADIRITRTPGQPVTVEPEDQSWCLELDDNGMPSLWIGVDAPADDMSAEERDALPAGEPIVENGVEIPTFRGWIPAEMFYETSPELRPACERTMLDMWRAPENQIAPVAG